MERITLIHLACDETETLRARHFIARALDKSNQTVVAIKPFSMKKNVWFHCQQHDWRADTATSIDPPTIEIKLEGKLYLTHDTWVCPFLEELSTAPPLRRNDLLLGSPHMTLQQVPYRRPPISDIVNMIFVCSHTLEITAFAVVIPDTTYSISISTSDAFPIDSDSVLFTIKTGLKDLKWLSEAEKKSFVVANATGSTSYPRMQLVRFHFPKFQTMFSSKFWSEYLQWKHLQRTFLRRDIALVLKMHHKSLHYNTLCMEILRRSWSVRGACSDLFYLSRWSYQTKTGKLFFAEIWPKNTCRVSKASNRSYTGHQGSVLAHSPSFITMYGLWEFSCTEWSRLPDISTRFSRRGSSKIFSIFNSLSLTHRFSSALPGWVSFFYARWKTCGNYRVTFIFRRSHRGNVWLLRSPISSFRMQTRERQSRRTQDFLLSGNISHQYSKRCIWMVQLLRTLTYSMNWRINTPENIELPLADLHDRSCNISHIRRYGLHCSEM